jgi:adenylate cyclase
MKLFRISYISSYIIIFTTSCTVFLLTFISGILESTNSRTGDMFFLAEREKQSKNIVIVSIDEKSLQADQKIVSDIKILNWNKENYGKVIENLNQKQVDLIGIDIVFSQESSEYDKKKLQQVLKKYNNIILAAEPKVEHIQNPLYPLDIFRESAEISGILMNTDKDGVIRKYPISYDDPNVPFSLGISLYKKYIGIFEDEIISDTNNEKWIIGSTTLKKNNINYSPLLLDWSRSGEMIRIQFTGDQQYFPTISLIDIYNNIYKDKYTGELINMKNKIILIGEMGSGLHDDIFTPLNHSSPLPGVLVHANVVEQLLNNTTPKELSSLSIIAIIFIIICITSALFYIRTFLSIIVFMLLLVAIFIANAILHIEYYIISDIFYIFYAAIITFIGVIIMKYFYELQERKFIHDAFKYYLSPSQIKKIINNPKALKLGGEEKEITIFFSDIASFTTLSEALGVQKLVYFLNIYLKAMTDIITKYKGTLDKYEGDAIIAFWGAPIDDKNHAIHTCKTALLQQSYIKTLHAIFAKKDCDVGAFKVRIGIHTGNAFIGNFGSDTRFNYTMIGDSVNLAARLEGVSKVYNTSIIISEDTKKLLNDDFITRKLDCIQVKGKDNSTIIYELIDFSINATNATYDRIQKFEEAFDIYQNGEFEKASLLFEKIVKKYQDDPSKVFIERCKKYKNNPEKWNNGVYKMETK